MTAKKETWLPVRMEREVWDLLEQYRWATNHDLLELGEDQLNVSNLISIIVKEFVTSHAQQIRHRAAAADLAVTKRGVAGFFAADELAAIAGASGAEFPDVPAGSRVRRDATLSAEEKRALFGSARGPTGAVARLTREAQALRRGSLRADPVVGPRTQETGRPEPGRADAA